MNKTTPKQFKNSDPYIQRIYQFDSRERDIYINRSPNRLLKAVGNDLILRGCYPRTVELDGNILSVEICKGILIQDSTLIETIQDILISIDISLYDINNGYFIIHTDYDFDKTHKEDNKFIFIMQYISKDGNIIEPYGWDFNKNRIYNAILKYEIDTEEFVFLDYYDMIINGKRYYIRGLNNFNLINLTYDALRHYDAFIFDSINVLDSTPPVYTGDVWYEESNWGIADHANLLVFGNDSFYDPRYVIVKPVILDYIINGLKYNIYLGDANHNIILQEIDSGLNTQENQQNPNIPDIAQHPTFLFNEYQMVAKYHNLFLEDPSDKRNLCDPFLFPPEPWKEPLPSYNGFGEYGYICSGFHIIQYSTITRFSFPFDTGTATKYGEMSGSRYSCVGCNSSQYGYIHTGKNLYDVVNSSTKKLSIVDRFLFPFDSGQSEYLMDLTVERSNSSSFNSSKYGYVAGGSSFSIIERYSFPGQNGGFISQTFLITSKAYPTANNSSMYGYICGGLITNLSTTTIERYTFPLHVGQTMHLFNLFFPRHGNGSNNSSIQGYVHHNYDDEQNTIEKFSFSSFSNSILIGNLDTRKRFTSSNNSSTHGYICGGQFMDNNATTKIDRFTFPLDSGQSLEVGELNGSRWKTCAIDTVDFATMFI